MEPVRSILTPKLKDGVFCIGEWTVLDVGPEYGPYDIWIWGSDVATNLVSGLTIHRADHYLPLWELLLELSAASNIVLMGPALGEIGCLAATQLVIDQMPLDTLKSFGPPVITTDARQAIRAICGVPDLEI